MIPRSDITAWRSVAPWLSNEQVEQDLILSRVLVEIFSDSLLQDELAFRGGTALYKLYLKPPARYSEDIDLVQIREKHIGPVLDRLRQRLSFLESPRIKQGRNTNTLIFRFVTEIEPVVRMRLKIEINCREHFTVLGYKLIPFEVQTSWFSNHCHILTFDLNELLGTKLRALYQRKKGRDLFDLWIASSHPLFEAKKVVEVFQKYLSIQNLKISRKEFRLNLDKKMDDPDFLGDTEGLIHPSIQYNPDEAYHWICANLLRYLE